MSKNKKSEETVSEIPIDVAANSMDEIAEEDAAAKVAAGSEEDVNAIMKKYDKESNTRPFTGLMNVISKGVLALFSVYALYMNLFSTWDNRARKASFVGFIIILAFLMYPISKKCNKKNYIPFYDVLLAVIGCSGFFYFVFRFEGIVQRAGALTTLEIILGIASTVVLFEACRRVVGIPIMVVAGCFIAYYFYFQYSNLGINLRTIVYNLFYTDSGILGTPINVCSTYIVLFVIFGTFLEVTGISDVFIQLANSIAGSSSGGPAKVAVISSALCGMVSGSSVANTVTTGSVTIPLMKKVGYKPEFAGAVEAAASTGGQIMPPIMGAAAFLMAEYLGVPYGKVALMAILPAFLYFAGIFVSVHLEAKKLGLKGINRAELPKLLPLLAKRGYLLLPLVALIVLVVVTQALAVSAFLSIVLAMAVACFKNSKNLFFMIAKLVCIVAAVASAFVFGMVSQPTKYIALVLAVVIIAICQMEKNDAMNLKTFVNALAGGAKSCISVAIACAIAGIIAGVVTKTGIGNLLNATIGSVAEHSVLLALFLTMLTCIILGMGVPTTATFVIMATTCAPILTHIGIVQEAALMFVFYFGIVADITPPVALAAYAGSAIAKSRPMKTAVNASKLAVAAFVVPYVIALNPAMLLLGAPWYEILQMAVTSFIGVFGLAAGMEGFMLKKENWLERIAVIIGGLVLVYPGTITDMIGICLIVGVFLFQMITAKHKRTA